MANLLEVTKRPGHSFIRLPVTTGLNGAELRLAVHVLHGTTPGPVLALASTLHGIEWSSIPALRALTHAINTDSLSGTVLIVPVANPSGLAQRTRDYPDQSDSPDPNRIFPGQWRWSSDQLVSVLTHEVLELADCLIDFHVGGFGHADMDVLIGSDYPDDLSDQTEILALAMGTRTVRRAPVLAGFPGPRSSIGYAASVLKIPAMGVEIGGAGFSAMLQSRWQKLTVNGILSVMHRLGMVETAPDPRPERQLVFERAFRVNPKLGGILRSRFGGDALGTEVARGTLLGTVVSPYTGATIEELHAPVDGLLFMVARDHPVIPGGWAFGVASLEHGSPRWITNDSGDNTL